MKALLLILALSMATFGSAEEFEIPKSDDPNLTITNFAGSNLIKHPTGIAFTKDGKLLAVESHTHFAPDGYEGPKSDRIVWLQDTDEDGTADRRSIFFRANLVATMDIATHPETGAIYIATRNEVLRVWDKDGDGVADPDSVERKLVFLDTTADYPHNGVSGLCFDEKGDLFFGIGENYGADYTLRGSDGSSVSHGGEGGNIWHATRDGGKVRRYATGFWNPFGVCTAPGGHVFATDNDPSSLPPCRLHEIIEGGDYGYQYRYGRTGGHPFISWNGRLTGTLPMLHGCGEAPCDVIYHNGHLLVASWADHRLEHYPLTWNGTHFETERKILVQGGVDFRPVAFAFGPDGALYVSDWVKKDYKLHGHGAVWKIEGWNPEPIRIPKSPDYWSKRFDSWNQGSTSDDPWTVARVIRGAAHVVDDWPASGKIETPQQRLVWYLANRVRATSDPHGIVPEMLADPNPEAQLQGLKWICDHKLEKYRAEVEPFADDPPSPEMFHAAVTTLARLDGLPVDDKPIQRLIGSRLQAAGASPKVKRAAFHVLANREKFLSVRDLSALYDSAAGDDEFRIDVMLAMLVHPDRKRAKEFAAGIARDRETPQRIRPFARDVVKRDFQRPDAIQGADNRPANFELAAWQKHLAKVSENLPEAELDHGRRVFHRHCAVCHSALGFGKQGGPDLSTIGERGGEHILSSILNPSAEIAPQFQAWQLNLADGEQKIGFMLGQQGGNHFYADAAGNEFKIYNRDIVTRAQVPVSIMPPALVYQVSDRELRDLLAWLESLK